MGLPLPTEPLLCSPYIYCHPNKRHQLPDPQQINLDAEQGVQIRHGTGWQVPQTWKNRDMEASSIQLWQLLLPKYERHPHISNPKTLRWLHADYWSHSAGDVFNKPHLSVLNTACLRQQHIKSPDPSPPKSEKRSHVSAMLNWQCKEMRRTSTLDSAHLLLVSKKICTLLEYQGVFHYIDAILSSYTVHGILSSQWLSILIHLHPSD